MRDNTLDILLSELNTARAPRKNSPTAQIRLYPVLWRLLYLPSTLLHEYSRPFSIHTRILHVFKMADIEMTSLDGGFKGILSGTIMLIPRDGR